MEFRILGPIDVRNDAGTVTLANKPRAVLAVLLLHANESVSSERLALALWGEDAPGGATKTVQMHVSRLRKALGDPGVVMTTAAGYRLRVSADELDAERFERLVGTGRDALDGGRPEQAAAILREAPALWRGSPLADLADEPFAAAEIARLDEQRLLAVALRVDADLAAGRHAALVAELQQLVVANPLDERFSEQLMLALYRCGRQAEALEVYARTRGVLDAQIGVEPGPRLRRLQEAILKQDASLQPVAVVAALPAELEVAAGLLLAGREDERAWIDAHWLPARGGAGTLVTIVGPRGIGKTRLAAEVATDCQRGGATVVYIAGGGLIDAAIGVLQRAASAESPTLVVVDDADRGGPRLARALEQLERELAASPVLVVVTGEDDGVLPDVGAERTLVLGPLHARAVTSIAREYAPASDLERVPTAGLLAASGGVPRRVHEAASRWARTEASRRVGAVAGRAAAGRADLSLIEEELTGDVVELQAVGERAARRAEQEALVVCPFKGLASFDVVDGPYFYGRDRLIAQLVTGLVGNRLLGVVGPSGSGKSSVVRAGLLPALAGGVLPGSEDWAQTVIRPGPHPMRELSAALSGGAPGTLVVAVDQFEETFTICDDEDERTAFVDALVGAADERSGNCIVVLALRADFYGSCAAYSSLSGLLAANHVLVGPMRHEELRRAIEGPAKRAGLRVDGDLTDALVRDVEGEPGALPLLSTALLELWQRREGRRLAHASYERTGGVRGAVSRLAEDAYGQLGDEQRRLARGVIMRLVGEGPTGGAERRRVAIEELKTLRSDDVGRVVALLTDRRLLIVGAGAVELAHEALLREWPRLREWIEEDRDGLRVQRNITAAAQEWTRTRRDDSTLYRGTRLAEAVEWKRANPHALTHAEHEFLAAGERRSLRDDAARRRRLLAACSGAVTVLLAIGIGVVLAITSRQESEIQRDVSASVELAARSVGSLESDPGLGRLQALAAYLRYPTQQARAAVRQAALDDRATAVVAAHGSALVSLAAGPGARRVALAGDDGSVRVWEPRSGRMVKSMRRAVSPLTVARRDRGTRGGPVAVAFSRDGKRLALVAPTGEIAVSDADGANRTVVTRIPAGPFPIPRKAVDFHPDGHRLVVAAGDAVHIVDLDRRTSSVLGRHGQPGGRVTTARFSTQGTEVVSVGPPGGARIWNVETGASRTLVTRDGLEAVDASFSPDDRRVATVDQGGYLRIWDNPTGRLLRSVQVSRAASTPLSGLTSVRYGATGQQIVTTGEDLRVYDSASASLLTRLVGHVGDVNDAAFAADGAVVSIGDDGMLRTWSPVAATTLRYDGPFVSHATIDLHFSADDERVVAQDGRGRIRRWDAASGREDRSGARIGSGGLSREAAAAPRVVRASLGGKLTLYDSNSGRPEVMPQGPDEPRALAIDAAGRHVAVAGRGSEIFVASAGGGPRRKLPRAGAQWRALAFNRDASQLAAAAADGTTSLYDVRTGYSVRTLTGHAGTVMSVAYSADGKRVVTAGEDRTVRISPVRGGPAVVLYGHPGAVNTANFDVAGDRIVTAGRDGTVRVWDASSGEMLAVVERYYIAHEASFSRDGKRIVSAGLDAVSRQPGLRIVPCEVCGSFASVLRLAESRADRPLDPGDRRQLVAADR